MLIITKRYRLGGPASKDWAFSRWMTVEKGIASIPSTAFYQTENAPTHYSRYAFCKSIDSLKIARKRLENAKLGSK